MAPLKPKLMLVENDPYFIYLLRLYAEQSGFSVVTTNSGLGALSLAQHERPAVIVIEWDLPEITGRELLQDFRSEPSTRDTPVVLCLWLDSHQHCDASDKEVVLYKPMQYEDFVAALRSVGVWLGGDLKRPRLTPP